METNPNFHTRAAVHGTEAEIEEVREKVRKFIEELCQDGEAPGDEVERRRYRLTLAFFPLPDRPRKRAR